MLASGEVFGRDQPVALQLLGSDRSREALEGVAMELEDRWGSGGWGLSVLPVTVTKQSKSGWRCDCARHCLLRYPSCLAAACTRCCVRSSWAWIRTR